MKFERSHRELLQLFLVFLSILVLFEEFVDVTPFVGLAAQVLICLISAGLSVALYQIHLKIYSFLFALSAFCFGPLFFEMPTQYSWIRPNVFISILSIFLFFVLQHYTITTHRKKGTHVRTHTH